MPQTTPAVPVTAQRVRLLDEKGKLIRLIGANEAETLLATHRVEARGTKTRIRSLRYYDAASSVFMERPKLRNEGLADPNRRESDTNVKGCWTFDRIPNEPRTFLRVVAGVLQRS